MYRIDRAEHLGLTHRIDPDLSVVTKSEGRGYPCPEPLQENLKPPRVYYALG